MSVQTAVECMKFVVEKGGPDPEDYLEVVRALDVLHSEEFEIVDGLARRRSTNEEFARLMAENWRVFNTTATMQGFVRLKPHGYAGDFEIIERIYNRQISADPNLSKWDTFFHLSDGANSVRNRAELLNGISAERRPKTLLSVGGGPGLDLRTVALSANPPKEIVLVDTDAQAIKRAEANLAFASEAADIKVELQCRNAVMFRSATKFDVIWSSGLFDYLVDRVACTLMKRLKQALAPGGVMVVGNFSVNNASRAYCEVIGEWLLIHRTPEDLMKIAEEAGFERSKLEVTADPTGLNLFLIAHG
ncbi:class I SAM-dependent methyltransferase [Agrobacterium salinitolerans]|nr:class I SAM-dependent methyltransferase [Agrobacterium salinitolerans]